MRDFYFKMRKQFCEMNKKFYGNVPDLCDIPGNKVSQCHQPVQKCIDETHNRNSCQFQTILHTHIQQQQKNNLGIWVNNELEKMHNFKKIIRLNH